MKFCSFSANESLRFGIELDPAHLCDVREAGIELLGAGSLKGSNKELFESRSLKEWLTFGEGALETSARIKERVWQGEGLESKGVYSRQQSRMLAPIQDPSKIIAVGLNYLDHAEEQKVQAPERPLIFAKFPSSIVGPDEPIKIPSISKQVDPEAELCIVMLKRGRGFTTESAKLAAGFMVGNDVSARDLQYSDKQWVRGKSCDSFAPCGPFVVTGADIGDPNALDIQLKVNDRVQQASNTKNLIFDSYQLIQFISETITLEPGDIIFTGTPSGVGVFRDPQVFLKPGDVLEVTIQNLGTLRNPVVAG